LCRGCRSTFGSAIPKSATWTTPQRQENAEVWVGTHHGESICAIEFLPSNRTRSQTRSRRLMHTFLPPQEDIPGHIFAWHVLGHEFLWLISVRRHSNPSRMFVGRFQDFCWHCSDRIMYTTLHAYSTWSIMRSIMVFSFQTRAKHIKFFHEV